MIGTKLGPYEIVEQIGEGGMATVYRAYQPSVDRFVAVKVIRPSIAEDEGAMARFQREARVVARLEHVHVLPIYDFSLAPPYLVMRYLEGGTLRDVLRQGPLPLHEIGFLLRQVAAALDYAHQQGVVHRDVKPSNVLLDGQGNAFVSDFGIAHVAGQGITQSGALMGTPGYMAPEQITGRAVDHRSDLYALGVVVFEMLTGRLPFQAENPMEALFKHVNEAVPSACALNGALPIAVDEALRRSMAKDPAARYGTASELSEAVIDVLGESLVRTPQSLQTTAQAFIQCIAAEREEKKEELEATMATFASMREGELAERAHHTPTEQNRLVTALYANLAEVAEVVEDEGAQAVRDTLERLWEGLEGVIANRGGRVQVRTYETALVLWGIEVAREDDPERAIRTALEMQEVVRRFLDEEEGGEPLPMQVSITTGLALLAPGKGSDNDAVASGATISLAHRLERVAPPGSILISHDTYRHVRGVFEVEAGDPLRVRGRKRSLETYVVRAAKPRAFRLDTRGVEDVETRMVGRRAELERLQEAFYTAVEDGETQVVTVVSEPGLGKSRLLYEFTNWMELEEAEAWLAWARATSETAQRPYALLRDLFSYRFAIRDNDSPTEVRAKMERGIAERMGPAGVADPTRMAHFIGHLIGYDYLDSPHLSAAVADAQGFHQEATHHLVQFFLHLCRQTPVILQLADIHWADDSSLGFINGLVRSNPELPMLVVCLARPELYERRPAWGSGQPFHTRVELRPLSRRESRRLVAEVLQKVDEVPDALRDLVAERAEGNPFYIEELIRVLIEDRVIDVGPERWHVESERLSGVRVPSTLTGLIQAQLDGLFPAERAVLQRAAVVGRVFWDDAVRALGKADDFTVTVTDVLRGLAERGLVHARAESAFGEAREHMFASNILRDVVLEGTLGRQRRAYHVLAAEWLVVRSGERADEYAGAIADHLERAGETERAVPYLRRAGERAAAQYANDEAVAYLSHAIDLTQEDAAQQTPERMAQRYALLLAREEVYGVQGAREARREDLAALEALAEALDDGTQQATSRRAEVAVRRAGIADHSTAIAAAQAAVHLAQAAHDVALEARGYLAWSGTLLNRGDYEAARHQAERALALAQDASLRGIEAVSLQHLGYVSLGQDDYAAAKTYFERDLHIRREMGDRGGEGHTLRTLGGVFYQQGEYAAARTCLEQALRICQEIGYRDGQRWTLTTLSLVSGYSGDYAGAVDILEQALYAYGDAGNQGGTFGTISFLARAHMRLGNHTVARDYAEQALRIPNVTGSIVARMQALLGLLSHYLGDDEAAREYSQQALRLLHPPQETRRVTADSLIYLGHTLIGLGQLAEAADAYRQALNLRRELKQSHLTPDPLAGLARVALAQERQAQALVYVEEILSYLESYPTLDGTEEPLRVYLTCYWVLRANEDARAVEILGNGYSLLQEWAAAIEDENLRCSFLENVAAHREIIAEWESGGE